jgi:RNA polymerase sigma-B factor
MISQDAVVDLFNELDKEIYKVVLTISCVSPHYIYSYIVDTAASMMAGTSGNRGIYFKSRYKTAEDNNDNEIIKQANLKFSNKCFTLINSLSVENPDPSQIIKLLKNCYFFRVIIEEAIDNFMSDCKEYLSTSTKMSAIHSIIEKEGNQKLWIDYSAMSIKMQNIEDKIGIDRDKLYGCFMHVKELLNKVIETKHNIILPYLRSVYSITSRVSKDPSKFDNNYQNGILGAMYAIGRFDQSICKSFGSFLKTWVQQSILIYIKIDNFIKLPLNIWQTNACITRRRKNTAEIDLDLITNEEIAEETNFKLKQVKSVLDNIRLTHVYTLDHPIEGEEGVNGTLIDTLEDKSFSDTDASELVKDIIGILTDDEKKIICLTFGIIDQMPNKKILSVKQILNETLKQKLSILQIFN